MVLVHFCRVSQYTKKMIFCPGQRRGLSTSTASKGVHRLWSAVVVLTCGPAVVLINKNCGGVQWLGGPKCGIGRIWCGMSPLSLLDGSLLLFHYCTLVIACVFLLEFLWVFVMLCIEHSLLTRSLLVVILLEWV